MDIAPRTINHIIRQDLGLGAFKRQTGGFFFNTVALKENRKEKKKIITKNLFIDETFFSVEEIFNKRNFMHGPSLKPQDLAAWEGLSASMNLQAVLVTGRVSHVRVVSSEMPD